jgi:ATP-dependent RNA helicase RhlE
VPEKVSNLPLWVLFSTLTICITRQRGKKCTFFIQCAAISATCNDPLIGYYAPIRTCWQCVINVSIHVFKEKLTMNFDDLGLAEPLLRAIQEQGYTKPSPIQAKAIPLVLSGKDVMAAAQTGTGKTAGFALPLLQRLASGAKAPQRNARALILTPTRELAAQVGQSVAQYGKYLGTSSTVVFGGVKINPQISTLYKGVDTLVATPGRLLDLHGQGAVKFDSLEVLILDEADRMLDMGFIHDIRRILKLLPKKRQTLMFSATFSKPIRALAADFLRQPTLVEVSPPNSTAERVEQWVYPVDKKRKPELLSHLVKENSWQQVLVFTRTKHGANRLCKQLVKDGIRSAAIHGNKSQNARTQALDEFKRGKIQALVATDIAARGLDIDQLPQVVNFDLPNISEDYIHRIGRTGRAGLAGSAHSLVSADEADNLYGIERLIHQELPQQQIDGFEPEHSLPARRIAPPRRPSGTKQGKYNTVNRPRGKNATAQPGNNRGRSRRRSTQAR